MSTDPTFEELLSDPLWQTPFDSEILPHLLAFGPPVEIEVRRCRCAAVHRWRPMTDLLDLAASAPDRAVDAASTTPPRVIGLDLSLTESGISDGTTTWLIKSSGKAEDGLPQRQARLRKLRAEVITHCEGAALVVIEGPAYSKTTGHAHDRGGLWWLVVMALGHRGIPVAEVPSTTLKKYATGNGGAKKGAMIDAAARRLPEVITGGNDNCADALWAHAMGLDHLTGRHVVPASHRVTLDVVRWPAVTS